MLRSIHFRSWATGVASWRSASSAMPMSAMSRDSVLVIHSTVSVALCWEIAVEGARRGVHVLDAPVSGARAGAVNGTLTIMVGGDPSLQDRVTPLLKSYGRLIQWMGPVGSGQKMKVLNN